MSSMSDPRLSHSYPLLDEAKKSLRQILASSTTCVVGLCVQRIVEVGLQALGTLEMSNRSSDTKMLPGPDPKQPHPAVHELAQDMARHVDDVCKSFQNVSEMDRDLESGVAEFIEAITQVYEKCLRLKDSDLLEGVKAFETHIEKVSAKIVWRIVSTDGSGLASEAATDTEVVRPSSDSKSNLPTADDQLRFIYDTLRTVHSLLDGCSSDKGSNFGMMVLLGGMVVSLRKRILSLCAKSRVPASGAVAPNAVCEEVLLVIALIRSLVGVVPGDQTRPSLDGGVSLTDYGYTYILVILERVFKALQDGVAGLSSDASDSAATFSAGFDVLRSDQESDSRETRLRKDVEKALELLRSPASYARGAVKLSDAISLLRGALLEEHPMRGLAAALISTALRCRYELKRNYSDVTEAVTFGTLALQLLPRNHELRPDVLDVLCGAFATRYKHENNVSHLSEAIRYMKEDLELCRTGRGQKELAILLKLHWAVHLRYIHDPSVSDLSEAIRYARQALQLGRGSGSTLELGPLYNSLCAKLLARYDCQRNTSDLSEAIRYAREALRMCRPDDRAGRAEPLDALTSALLYRFQRNPNVSDVSEAIKHLREAVKLPSEHDSPRVTRLNRLISALVARYGLEGNVSDLSEATEYSRKALGVEISDPTIRADVLQSFVVALCCWSDREDSVSNVSEAIRRCRELLKLLPHGHAQRQRALSSLACCLRVRSRCRANDPGSEQPSDLAEAIQLYRDAAESYPPSDPRRILHLSDLAEGLIQRYVRCGSASDLSEAKNCSRQALELCPPGHPYRFMPCSDLAVALLLENGIGDANDPLVASNMRLAVDMFREAAATPSHPRALITISIAWIKACRLTKTRESLLDAYKLALNQRHILLVSGSTLEDKYSQLYPRLGSALDFRSLGLQAASCALREGYPELAVELLEQGRNFLFNQVGRYRVKLNRLRSANPGLVERFSKLSRELDASVMSEKVNMGMARPSEDSSDRYRRIVSEWEQVVESIRALEGLEDFLKPAKYATLKATATEGPIILLLPATADKDHCHALIVHGNGTPHHLELPKAKWTTMSSLVQDLLGGTQSIDEWEGDRIFTRVLRKLWDIMVGPIAETLENVLRVPLHSRIWWCPAGSLSTLPFHAAGYYSPGRPNLNLPDKYISSYTPTLQALLRSRTDQDVVGAQRMLIVAQPDTPGQEALPGVRLEAELVESLVGPNMGTSLLLSERGTHAAVLSAMANHSWFHLTCHGEQNLTRPFDSGFVLYDRMLTLRDIMKGDLPNAEFAFLAACHTATGDFDLLDEGLHLAAGLQFAGFKSVVGTIWEVADEDGPVIAEAFYKALGVEGPEGWWDPSRAACALSEAVKHLRDIGTPINRWVRFIHIGI